MACPGTADTSISECNTLLDTTADYDVADDIAEQRNALIDFYNSTGGEYWSNSASGTVIRDQINLVETYLNLIGTLAAQANFSAAALPADYQRLYYALAQLSIGCSLQASVCSIPHCCCCDQDAIPEHWLKTTDIDHDVCLQRTVQVVKLLVKCSWTSGAVSQLVSTSIMHWGALLHLLTDQLVEMQPSMQLMLLIAHNQRAQQCRAKD